MKHVKHSKPQINMLISIIVSITVIFIHTLSLIQGLLRAWHCENEDL